MIASFLPLRKLLLTVFAVLFLTGSAFQASASAHHMAFAPGAVAQESGKAEHHHSGETASAHHGDHRVVADLAVDGCDTSAGSSGKHAQSENCCPFMCFGGLPAVQASLTAQTDQTPLYQLPLRALVTASLVPLDRPPKH